MPDKGFDSLQAYEIFLISETSRQALRMNKLSIPWVTGLSFRGVKWPRRDAEHSPPFSAEVEHDWSYNLLPLYAFIAPKGTTSPVPDIINSSFSPYAEFLSSITFTVYVNTTKNLVFMFYGILTLVYDV